MMGWVAFAVMLVIAIVLALALKRRNDAEMSALREQSRAEVLDLKSEARGRVDRLEREAGRSRNDSRDQLLGELLPAFDALSLARQQILDDDVGRGLDLVVADFARALEKHGVERIAPQPDDVFDPEVHEAVETLESDELTPGRVGRCHREGWRTDAKILRPALVGVVRAPQPEAEPVAEPVAVRGTEPE